MTFTLHTSEEAVPRGGRIAATVDGLEDGARADVALVVVERLSAAPPVRRHVVSSRSVTGSGPITVALPVPMDLPEPYESERGSIDLEVEAMCQHAVVDEQVSVPFHPAVTDRQRTDAPIQPGPRGEMSFQRGSVPSSLWGVAWVAAVVLLMVFAAGWWRVAGVVVATMAVALLVMAGANRRRRQPLGVRYRVVASPVPRGGDLLVELDAPPGVVVDAGLRTVEVSRTGLVAPPGHLRRVVIGERWAPRTNDVIVAIPVPSDTPPTFHGDYVAICHELVLHPAGVPRANVRYDTTAAVAVSL